MKPLDTYARLAIKHVYGRERVKVANADQETTTAWEPLAALRDWSLRPEFWNEQEIILIDMMDYMPFKRRVLAESIRVDLKSIAERSGTTAAAADAADTGS